MKPLRLVEYGLAAVGVLLLGYCVAVYTSARLFQSRAARSFAHRPAAPSRSALPAAPSEGAVVGRLEIPRLKLAVIVIEGDKPGDLRRAAGHIPGTALPGEPGNVAIAAHRDTFFRPLRLIRRNDSVFLDTRTGTYRYRVVSTDVVPPADTGVLAPAARDTLTLVTCYPFHYIGSAPKRFIVRAERQDPRRQDRRGKLSPHRTAPPGMPAKISTRARRSPAR
jgi:sortase A